MNTLCRFTRRGAVLLLAGGLLACGRPEPVRLGFLGTLSKGASDVGEAGRNGVMLAVEQRNAAGGIQGQPIELLIEDDAQSAQKAAAGFKALVAARTDIVIGPFTSAMAAAIVPLANEAQQPVISPTVTSLDFVGKDDQFIRIHRSTRDNAGDYARKLFERGQRQLAVAYDLRNKSFSQSWLAEFRSAFVALGGAVSVEVPFGSGAEVGYGAVVQALLAGRSDGLLFIANAVDSARLGQRARLVAPEVRLATAEWAASETLVELGGGSIDHMLVLQPYDREDRSPRYAAFREAFKLRFKREPGYSAVAAHDAATVALDAIAGRKSKTSLKEAILAHGPFQGLQQQIEFDRHGDTQRRVVFSEVVNGRFVAVP